MDTLILFLYKEFDYVTITYVGIFLKLCHQSCLFFCFKDILKNFPKESWRNTFWFMSLNFIQDHYEHLSASSASTEFPDH
jgi:hypothetical protein